MLSRLPSFMRSSVIALAAVATLPAAAPAAPLGPSIMPSVADNTMNPTLVGDGYRGNGRSGGPGYWPRHGGGRGWNGGGRGWNGGGGHWNGGGNWGGRHYRHGYRHGYGHNYYNNSGIYLGLGLGALGYGLGYGSGYYHDPYYNEPIYRPRRAYRGVASNHVEWCYNRYRSYRAWDNTFQPYHGSRQQCYSPYS